MRKIFQLMEERPAVLLREKKKGKKIVGIVGMGYTPEELVYAAGAIPQRLMKGGEQSALEDSRQYCHNCFSTFHKAQIGYLLRENDPIYSLPDYFVFESGDEHSEMTGVYVYPHKEMHSSYLGIPGDVDFPEALPYYQASLTKLKQEIEMLTGEKVTDESLEEYIDVFNEIRNTLKKIATLRKEEVPPISGHDFIKLSHASYFCEPYEYLDLLRSVYDDLKTKRKDFTEKMPRIAVFGCPMGAGDYGLLELIAASGAKVVTESLSGSIRTYQNTTMVNGSPMESLAKRYFSKKRTDAYCYPWGDEHSESFIELVNDYRVNGVIWYQLMFMVIHSMLGYTIEKQIKKMGIPAIKIQTEYDLESRFEAVKTRVETFVEIIKGK